MEIMVNTTPRDDRPIALIVGASRGLGAAIAAEYLRLHFDVIGTAREGSPAELEKLAADSDGRLEIEHVDITDLAQVQALRARLQERLGDRRLALLFVVAGISFAEQSAPSTDMSEEQFAAMMLTNAFAPVRTIDALEPIVEQDGSIAIMTSGQGSIANNTSGGFEVYRASKAALNQLMRSYAARHPDEQRALLLMAPGWVQTAMGGARAPLTIAESIPELVSTVEAQRGIPGLRYLDRHGTPIAW